MQELMTEEKNKEKKPINLIKQIIDFFLEDLTMELLHFIFHSCI